MFANLEVFPGVIFVGISLLLFFLIMLDLVLKGNESRPRSSPIEQFGAYLQAGCSGTACWDRVEGWLLALAVPMLWNCIK